jgi:hypothetical protein
VCAPINWHAFGAVHVPDLASRVAAAATTMASVADFHACAKISRAGGLDLIVDAINRLANERKPCPLSHPWWWLRWWCPFDNKLTGTNRGPAATRSIFKQQTRLTPFSSLKLHPTKSSGHNPKPFVNIVYYQAETTIVTTQHI